MIWGWSFLINYMVGIIEPLNAFITAEAGMGILRYPIGIETTGGIHRTEDTVITDFIDQTGGIIIRKGIIIEVAGIISHGLIIAIGTGEDGGNRTCR